MAPSFEWIADLWLEQVRNQGNAWFGVNASASLERLPPPGRATLEVGCGESTFGRGPVARWARIPLFLHVRAVRT